MTIAVQGQNTASHPVRTGPLTVPLQIISAAGARHRTAVADRRALPAWALLSIAGAALAVLALAVLQWHGWVSVVVVFMTVLSAASAFALDVVGTLQAIIATDEEI